MHFSINTFTELLDERFDDADFRQHFSSVVRRDIRRLFPPEGDVAYFGSGMVSEAIGGKLFTRACVFAEKGSALLVDIVGERDVSDLQVVTQL